MRAVITGSSLILALILCILIHCSIVNGNIRENETNAGLNQAVDYGLDIMEEQYADMEYIPGRENEYTQILMQQFCKAVNEKIMTDGQIEVNLIYSDYEKGKFDILVKQKYSYLFGDKKGECSCHKAVTFFDRM